MREDPNAYMMPNALKLVESVEETADEVPASLSVERVVIPASSATIAAGVVMGFVRAKKPPKFVIHLGYSRSATEVEGYLRQQSRTERTPLDLLIVDEGYDYKDVARAGITPPFPCNEYYDLKALRWYLTRFQDSVPTLFWNIG
jgi:hypothetical protein